MYVCLVSKVMIVVSMLRGYRYAMEHQIIFPTVIMTHYDWLLKNRSNPIDSTLLENT